MLCPYCGAEAHIKPASFVYASKKSKNWERVWVCDNFPKCDSYVGCHKGTDIPKGRLANSRLRYYKKEAHKAFDPIWQSGLMNRRDSYKWLADMLHISLDDCHIGMFDVKMCQRVISVCNRQDNNAINKYRGSKNKSKKYT